MSDNAANQTPAEPTPQPTPSQEPQGTETDWKSESRKWEARAKENKKLLDETQKTLEGYEAEKQRREQKEKTAAETIEELKTQLAEANAKAEREKMVRSVAKETGADPEILLLMNPDSEGVAREYAAKYLESVKSQAPKSKWPDVKDKGESKAHLTKKEILAIEDKGERRKAKKAPARVPDSKGCAGASSAWHPSSSSRCPPVRPSRPGPPRRASRGSSLRQRPSCGRSGYRSRCPRPRSGALRSGP